MALYDTVANIVSDTSVELGLGTVSDVFASTDANVVQLRGLLKTVGRDLFLRHTWLQQHKEHNFTTDGSGSYSLPADFSRMLDQTGWNRSSKFIASPASPQEWQYLNANSTGSVLSVIFRPYDQTLKVWPTTSSGATIYFEYASRYWVRATASSAPDKDAPTVNTDVIHIDATLMVKALRLSFLRAKGFDTTAAQREFDELLESTKSANANAAPTLHLNKQTEDKLIDESNAPASGYGMDGFGGLF